MKAHNIKDTLIVLTAAILMAVGLSHYLPELAHRIQTNLAQQIQEELQKNDFPWVEVSVDGRNVEINGMAADRQEYNAVEALFSNMQSIHRFENHLQIQVKRVTPYTLTGNYVDQKLTLSGYLPNTQAQQAVQQQLDNLFTEQTVENNLQLASGDPVYWQTSVALLLDNLAQFQRARLEVLNYDIRLTGVVATTEQAKKIQEDLKVLQNYHYHPQVYIKAADEKKPLKRVTPYTLNADYKDRRLQIAGYFPTPEQSDDALKLVKKIFLRQKVSNEIQMASGEPVHWAKAVVVALQAVEKFENARLEMTDYEVRLTGQVATTETAQSLEELRRKLLEYNYHLRLFVHASDEKARVCQRKFNVLLADNQIQFASNSAIIESASYKVLENLFRVTENCSKSKVTIEGHTDNVGNEQKNLQLSQQRAEAVRDYLIQNGMDAERLQAIGYGETRPITDNDSVESRAKNRRIEFTIEGY